jgi:cytochrome c oxidase assembly protein subunit 15
MWPKVSSPTPMRLRASSIALLMLVLCQIYWGALVAGLRAGLLYNTWPLIDGHVVPAAASLFFNEPWWRNLFENPLTVQFMHRGIAYVLFVAALLHAVDAVRAGRGALALALAGAVTIQAALGIATLIQQVPIGLALAHQGMAIVVLAIAVVHAERLMPRRSAAPAGAPIARAAAK